MTIRYFKTPGGGVQYGNVTEESAAALLDAGHEEITAEEHQAEEARLAEAAAAFLQPSTDTEQTKEVAADGGNGRKRRR